SNKAISDDHIAAKGYGSQKPITSNKTAAGRTQNRRVDILIQNVLNFEKGASSTN
ncbi:MAG: flagellar motor protein MotB, partial [Bdellovibrionales bacterium]|nr:flagellar motor protein MotB [Oligoflexia bacterium]